MYFRLPLGRVEYEMFCEELGLVWPNTLAVTPELKRIVNPALKSGEIDMMAEYTGALLNFEGGTPSTDSNQTYTDLQAAIVYLASEASDYMIGHNLVIEGGQSLW